MSWPRRQIEEPEGPPPRGGFGLCLAVIPAVFFVLVGAAAWIAAEATGDSTPAVAASYGLPIGLMLGVTAPILIAVTRQRDALAWTLVSICLTAVGLLIGAFLWWGAATVGCGGTDGCLG